MANQEKRLIELNASDANYDDNGRSVQKTGRRGKPEVELYRPGSGPLRKTTQGVEEDAVGNASDRNAKPVESASASHDIQDNFGNTSVHSNRHAPSEFRKKNKKPEQAMYVPKPVVQARMQREFSNRNLHNQKDAKDSENWDSDKKAHDGKLDLPLGNRRSERFFGRGGTKQESDFNSAHRCSNKSHNSTNRHKRRSVSGEIDSREIRHASEPRGFPPKSSIEVNRTRDSRSVEPVSGSLTWSGEFLQGKPPSGRRGNREGGGSYFKANSKFSASHFEKRQVPDKGTGVPTSQSCEEMWDGSSVTFIPGPANLEDKQDVAYQSSTQPTFSDSQQPLSLSQLQPQGWSHTLPIVRSRGRGRLRPEEMDKNVPFSLMNNYSVSRDDFQIPSLLNGNNSATVSHNQDPLGICHENASNYFECEEPPNVQNSGEHEDFSEDRSLVIVPDTGPSTDTSPPATHFKKCRSSIPDELDDASNEMKQDCCPEPISQEDAEISPSLEDDDFLSNAPLSNKLDWSEDVDNELPQVEAVLLCDGDLGTSIIDVPDEANSTNPPREERQRKRRNRNKNRYFCCAAQRRDFQENGQIYRADHRYHYTGKAYSSNVEHVNYSPRRGNYNLNSSTEHLDYDNRKKQPNDDHGRKASDFGQGRNAGAKERTKHFVSSEQIKPPPKTKRAPAVEYTKHPIITERVKRGFSTENAAHASAQDTDCSKEGANKESWNTGAPSSKQSHVKGILHDDPSGVNCEQSKNAPIQERNKHGPNYERANRGTRHEYVNRGLSSECSNLGQNHGLHREVSNCGPRRCSSGERSAHGVSYDRASRGPPCDRMSRVPNYERSNRGPNKDNLNRTPSQDHLNRGLSQEQLSRGPSQDRLYRGPSQDRLYRGPSQDRLYRGPSQDRLYRGPSQDRLYRGPSQDRLYRGPSQDRLYRGPSQDRLYRGPSQDRIYRGPSQECLNRGLAQDRLSRRSSCEQLYRSCECISRGPSFERLNCPSYDRLHHGQSHEHSSCGSTQEHASRGANRECRNRAPSRELSNYRTSNPGSSREQKKSGGTPCRECSGRGTTVKYTNSNQIEDPSTFTRRDPSRETAHGAQNWEHSYRGQNRKPISRGPSLEYLSHEADRDHTTFDSSSESRTISAGRECNRRGQFWVSNQEQTKHVQSPSFSQAKSPKKESKRGKKKLFDRGEKWHEDVDNGEKKKGSKLDERMWNEKWRSRCQEKRLPGERRDDKASHRELWREENNVEPKKELPTQRAAASQHTGKAHPDPYASEIPKERDVDVAVRRTPESQVAGILVLPATCSTAARGSHSYSSSGSTDHSEQPVVVHQRQLYDPKNPDKPIVISAPGSRAARPEREYEAVPVTAACYCGYPMYPDIPGQALGTYMSGDPSSATNYYSPPAWLDPCNENNVAVHYPDLIVEAEQAIRELHWLTTFGSVLHDWDRITSLRHIIKTVLQTFLTMDIKFCEKENIEKYLWTISIYNIIEKLRDGMTNDPEHKEEYKKKMLSLIEDGTAYMEHLLQVLEQAYKFNVENFLLPHSSSSKSLGYMGLALISVQKIFLFLGDLARYREQANETSNYGKARQWYIKAHQINPKNGRPYNQLAVIAVHAKRRVDAVYYYMRSLMASNPFCSARENLILLFDESRRKFEHLDKKRREERSHIDVKEKESGKGLHREFWVHPRQGIPRLHITSAVPERLRDIYFQEEELKKLDHLELNKRFSTSYLNVHGKLFSRVGMDTFQETALHMLLEFRALLQHTPIPLNANRFLQLLALNMYSIENTQLKEGELEPHYRAALQEYALIVALQMFNIILERCNSLLKEQLENSTGDRPRLLVCEDMLMLLPAIKVWCDWLLCHGSVWNPPPSCAEYKVGPPDDPWTRLAVLMNLLEQLKIPRDVLVFSPEEGCDIIRLPEDATLSDFAPLMYNSEEVAYCNKDCDMELAQVALRLHRILFFGTVFLCGIEPPVLKLQHTKSGIGEYVSVCQPPPTEEELQNNSELQLESFSEDEAEEVVDPTDAERRANIVREALLNEGSETLTLLRRKQQLELDYERHKIIVQEILKANQVFVEMEVKPRLLVPDTNTFIDHLSSLKKIIDDGDENGYFYTYMVPLVVFRELDGLSLGSKNRIVPEERAEHTTRVAEAAKEALNFLRSKHPRVRSVTTRGTIINISSCVMHEEEDEYTCNDDRILATAVSLCSPDNPQDDDPGSSPRRVYRDVVLLTEDRCMRLKAMTKLIPTRDIPQFIEWAGLN